jgi:hypothetical protein
MVRERCSAEQLADMMVQKINVAEVEVAARRSRLRLGAYGCFGTC